MTKKRTARSLAMGMNFDLAPAAQYGGVRLVRPAVLGAFSAVKDSYGGYVPITSQGSFFRDLLEAIWASDQSLWAHLDVGAARWQHFEADQKSSFDFWYAKQANVPGGLAPLYSEPLAIFLGPPGLDAQVIDDIETVRRQRRGEKLPAGEAFSRLSATGAALLDVSRAPSEMAVYVTRLDTAELRQVLLEVAERSGVQLHPAHLFEL